MAIAALFAGGQVGLWYDPNDLFTLFQDAAGTTPVTAVGQSVGLIRDKSGNGGHASQTVTSKCPVLAYDSTLGRNYLLFDGVDDYLQTANGFCNTAALSMCLWFWSTSLSGYREISGFPNDPATNVNPYMRFSLYRVPTNTLQARRDFAVAQAGGLISAYPPVVYEYHSTDGNVYANRALMFAGPSGTVTYGTAVPFRIAANGTGAENSDLRLFGLVLLGRDMNSTERTQTYADLTGIAGQAAPTSITTAAATGSVNVQGHAAVSISATPSGAAAIAVQGLAAGAVASIATGTGALTVNGQGGATAGATAAATGVAAVRGQGAAAIGATAAGSGPVAVRGQGTATIGTTASAAGTVAGSTSAAPLVSIPGCYRMPAVAGHYRLPPVAGRYRLRTISGRWRAAS
jgi:hypothetical protein